VKRKREKNLNIPMVIIIMPVHGTFGFVQSVLAIIVLSSSVVREMGMVVVDQ
jgi:hypothetical protein